jgi:hypothetical protein
VLSSKSTLLHREAGELHAGASGLERGPELRLQDWTRVDLELVEGDGQAVVGDPPDVVVGDDLADPHERLRRVEDRTDDGVPLARSALGFELGGLVDVHPDRPDHLALAADRQHHVHHGAKPGRPRLPVVELLRDELPGESAPVRLEPARSYVGRDVVLVGAAPHHVWEMFEAGGVRVDDAVFGVPHPDVHGQVIRERRQRDQYVPVPSQETPPTLSCYADRAT